MTRSIVQRKAASDSALSVSNTLASMPTAGNLLVAVIKENSITSTITLPTGFTWMAGCPFTGGAGRQCGFALKVAGEAEPTTRSFSSNETGLKNLTVYELADVKTSGHPAPVGTASGAAAITKTLDASGTLPKPECIVIAFCEQSTNNGGETSVNQGFTLRDNAEYNSFMVADLVTSNDASLNPTFEWVTSRQATGMIAVFPEVDASLSLPDLYVYDGSSWVPHTLEVLP